MSKPARCPATLPLFFLALLIAAAIVPTTVRAELAEPAEMEQVCRNWIEQVVFNRGSWANSDSPQIVATHELLAGDTLVARWYDISPRGFVLVAVLKEMTPVKAYSDRFDLDENQAEGFIRLMRETIGSRVHLYAETFGSLDAVQPADGPAVFGRGQKAEWDRLGVATSTFQDNLAAKGLSSMTEGGPLTTTSWHQSAPYNNVCPIGDGGRSVVGCVATATSQIMAYWQWPPNGYGSHSYIWDGDQYCGGDVGGGELTADFSDEYDWANIVDSCDEGCTPQQAAALAELCYEVGVAFEMDYSACGSGAYTGYAATVFPRYFKYSPEITRVDRNGYTLGQWFDLVKNEIDSSRVVQYRIRLHSIVLDGYREQTPGVYEYHMNYGWGNSFNAWYVFDSLYCGWVDGDICPADEEYMITHIFPQDQPVLSMSDCAFTEAAGNANGRANPGESIDMSVTVRNSGFDAANVSVTVTSADPYISIQTGAAAVGAVIGWGEELTTETPLTVSVDAGCPDPHVAKVLVTVTADGGHSAVDSALFFIGDTPGMAADFEIDDGLWFHDNFTEFYDDQWHRETYRSHSASTSWKVGGAGMVSYDNSLDASLVSPPFLMPVNGQLTFWHWRDIESEAEAWDGGIVMLSVDGGPWEQISPVGGYPDILVDNAANALPGYTPCYSGMAGWTQEVFDLSAYSGVAQIMFRFASDGFVAEEGWYVDDFEVASTGCCVGVRGNVNSQEEINVTDLTFLVNYLFKSGQEPPCQEEGDVDGSGTINVQDLTYLVNYIFKGGALPPDCP